MNAWEHVLTDHVHALEAAGVQPDRPWIASHCIECHGTDPDEGWHERCGCHDEPETETDGPALDSA